MTKEIDVPQGSGAIAITVTDHKYVRLLNSRGDETFRFDSTGRHITAVVQVGHWTIETDGKLDKVETGQLPERLRHRHEFDATKPPKLE